MATGTPSRGAISQNASPPMPFMCGYAMEMVAAAATMASIALPPSRKTARALCEAKAWGATAMPCVERMVWVVMIDRSTMVPYWPYGTLAKQLQVARHLLVRVGLRRHRSGLARRFPKSRALNVVGGRHWRERRQILCPDPGRRLESRGQFDQSGFAECSPEEADSERHAEHHTCRHLNDRIPRRRCKTRRTENEMIAVDEIGGPGRVVGRRDHRVELKPAERRVDAIDPGQSIYVERLVVGHPVEYWLRIVGSGCERLCLLKQILIEKRHLHLGVRVVEVDGALQRAARHRYTDSSGEVRFNVIAEVEVQHQ